MRAGGYMSGLQNGDFLSLFGKKSKNNLSLEAFLVFKKHCKMMRKMFSLFRSILPQSKNIAAKVHNCEGIAATPTPTLLPHTSL